MFFWSVFLKMHKKSDWPWKTQFLLFLVVNNIFLYFQNTDQNNICVSIAFKAKTKEKYEENFVLRFLFQNSKMPSFGGQPIFYVIFFPLLL